MVSSLGPQRSSVPGEPLACVAGDGSKRSEWLSGPHPAAQLADCEGGASRKLLLSTDIGYPVFLRVSMSVRNLKDKNAEREDVGSSGGHTHHCPLGTAYRLSAKAWAVTAYAI